MGDGRRQWLGLVLLLLVSFEHGHAVAVETRARATDYAAIDATRALVRQAMGGLSSLTLSGDTPFHAEFNDSLWLERAINAARHRRLSEQSGALQGDADVLYADPNIESSARDYSHRVSPLKLSEEEAQAIKDSSGVDAGVYRFDGGIDQYMTDFSDNSQTVEDMDRSLDKMRGRGGVFHVDGLDGTDENGEPLKPEDIAARLEAAKAYNTHSNQLTMGKVVTSVCMGLFNGVFFGLGDPIMAELSSDQCEPSNAQLQDTISAIFATIVEFARALIQLKFKKCVVLFKRFIQLSLKVFDDIMNIFKECENLMKIVHTMVVVICIAIVVTGAVVLTGLGFFLKVLSVIMTIAFGMTFLLRLAGNLLTAINCSSKPGGCSGDDHAAIIFHLSELIGFFIGAVFLSGMHKVIKAEGVSNILKASSFRTYRELFKIKAATEWKAFIPRMQHAKARFFSLGRKGAAANAASSLQPAVLQAKEAIKVASKEIDVLMADVAKYKQILARNADKPASSPVVARASRGLANSEAKLGAQRKMYNQAVEEFGEIVSKAGTTSHGYKGLVIQISDEVQAAKMAFSQAIRKSITASKSRYMAIRRARDAAKSHVKYTEQATTTSGRARHATTHRAKVAAEKYQEEIGATLKEILLGDTTHRASGQMGATKAADDLLAWTRPSADKLQHVWARRIISRGNAAYYKEEVVRITRIHDDLAVILEMAKSNKLVSPHKHLGVTAKDIEKAMNIISVQRTEVTAAYRSALAERAASTRLFNSMSRARMEKARELGAVMREAKKNLRSGGVIEDTSIASKIISSAEGMSSSALRITKNAIRSGIAMTWETSMNVRKSVAVYLMSSKVSAERYVRELVSAGDTSSYDYNVRIDFENTKDLVDDRWGLFAGKRVALLQYKGIFAATPARRAHKGDIDFNSRFLVRTSELGKMHIFFFNEGGYFSPRTCVGMGSIDFEALTPGAESIVPVPLTSCREEDFSEDSSGGGEDGGVSTMPPMTSILSLRVKILPPKRASNVEEWLDKNAPFLKQLEAEIEEEDKKELVMPLRLPHNPSSFSDTEENVVNAENAAERSEAQADLAVDSASGFDDE